MEFIFEHITQFPGCTDSSVCVLVKSKTEFTIGDICITDLEKQYDCIFEDHTDLESTFRGDNLYELCYKEELTHPWFMNLFFVKYGTKEETPLTVGKLIEVLKSFPEDLEVWIDSYGDQAMYPLSTASLWKDILILEHVPVKEEK